MLGHKILGYIRIAFIFLFSTLAFIFVFLVGLLPLNKTKWRLAIRRAWSRICLFILNFQVEVRGHLPRDRNYLFVGNHRSSLDPFVFLSYMPAYPVSRADVRKYPVIGKGAELSGIVFVEKSSRTSRSASKQAIYDALKSGKSIMIYPEGKTGAQPLTATFQKGSFDMAAELGIPVVPFAVEYKSLNDYWDHTDTMAVHFFKNLAKWKTDIRLSVGPVLQDENPWALLRQSQQWVNDEIIRLREDWGGLSDGVETVDPERPH